MNNLDYSFIFFKPASLVLSLILSKMLIDYKASNAVILKYGLKFNIFLRRSFTEFFDSFLLNIFICESSIGSESCFNDAFSRSLTY